MSEAAALLTEIAHCPQVQFCLEHPAAENPCREVVLSQQVPSLKQYQVPEPWSGQIEQAPLLFLSSNPSISSEEDYPHWFWSNGDIEDFFNYRFGGGCRNWTTDGTRSLQKDGTYSGSVRFWASVRRRSIELFDREVIPGVDYALSEIVHCKSPSEIGVKQAQDQCVETYLLRVLELSGANVIVVLGVRARQAVQKQFNIAEKPSVSKAIEVGGRQRLFAFLPHPNARGDRSFTKCLQEDELAVLQAALRQRSS